MAKTNFGSFFETMLAELDAAMAKLDVKVSFDLTRLRASDHALREAFTIGKTTSCKNVGYESGIYEIRRVPEMLQVVYNAIKAWAGLLLFEDARSKGFQGEISQAVAGKIQMVMQVYERNVRIIVDEYRSYTEKQLGLS